MFAFPKTIRKASGVSCILWMNPTAKNQSITQVVSERKTELLDIRKEDKTGSKQVCDIENGTRASGPNRDKVFRVHMREKTVR